MDPVFLYLLSQGAFGQQPSRGRTLTEDETALLKHCKDGDEKKVKTLLAIKELNKEVKSVHRLYDPPELVGQTPLILASRQGHLKIVRLLLNAGVDANLVCGYNKSSALHSASKFGFEKVMKLLLDKGADMELANEDGLTPLLIASLYGQQEAVKLLLARGVEKNKRDSGKHTALMCSAIKGYSEVVRLLLDAGASVNMKGDEGGSALFFASQAGKSSCVRLLLDAGANKEGKTNNGTTPLMIACAGKANVNLAVVKILIAADVKLEEKDIEGCTALMHACGSISLNVITELINSGAEAAIYSKKRKHSPLTLALTSGGNNSSKRTLYEISKLLVESGGLPVIDARNSSGDSAVSLACRYENLECVRLFLACGCDTEMLNNSNMTPRDTADKYCTGSNEEVCEIFELFNEFPVVWLLAALQDGLAIHLDAVDVEDLYQLFRSDRDAELVHPDDEFQGHEFLEAFFNAAMHAIN